MGTEHAHLCVAFLYAFCTKLREGTFWRPESASPAPSVSKTEPNRLSKSWLLQKGSSGVQTDTSKQDSWIQELPFSTNVKHVSQLTCQECGSCFKIHNLRQHTAAKRGNLHVAWILVYPLQMDSVYMDWQWSQPLATHSKFRITSEVDWRDKATPPNTPLLSLGICKVLLMEICRANPFMIGLTRAGTEASTHPQQSAQTARLWRAPWLPGSLAIGAQNPPWCAMPFLWHSRSVRTKVRTAWQMERYWEQGNQSEFQSQFCLWFFFVTLEISFSLV
jgi:hypothetical protein